MKTILLLFIAPLSLVIGEPNRKWHHDNWAEPSTLKANADPPVISIAEARIVEGDSPIEPRVVEVMVSLSQATSDPVKVEYNTRNGTALAGTDYVTAEDFILFSPKEMMKKIKVSIIGELLCEEDENFEVVLHAAAGATIDRSAGKVTIINDDDCRNQTSGKTSTSGAGSQAGKNPSTSGAGSQGSGKNPSTSGAGSGSFQMNLSVYEVRFTHTGYTTFITGPEECSVRPNGKVVLSGLVAGMENVPEHDDINYFGNLQLNIDIDICSTRPTGGDPPDVLCGMTVIGSGTVAAELDIYYDERGGYIKIEHKSGPFFKKVFGTCNDIQINEEEGMVPNQSIASIFNGMALPMLTNRTLRVGRYVERDGDIETVVEVLRKIR